VAELDAALEGRRPRVGVIALQDDKPLEAMLEALAPALDALVATTSGYAGHARPLPADAVAAAALAAGLPDVVAEPDPHAALARARKRAGTGGAVIVTGSLYLLERVRATALECR
jgi:folylpolyglutamate synthase/dihydropteroate synthase